jgi:hypothetical protein
MAATVNTGAHSSSHSRGLYREARQALRSLSPQALLNWRESRYYGRYGEVELHLLEFLCRRDRDAIDVGANDGSYVHFLRRHARHVIAFEPMPVLARARPEVPTRCHVRTDRLVRFARHRVAPHAGRRRRHGDGLLDGRLASLHRLSRPSRHRGADGSPRQRLWRRGGLHQDRCRGLSTGRAGGRARYSIRSGAAGLGCWSKSKNACRRAAWRPPRPTSGILATRVTSSGRDVSSRSTSPSSKCKTQPTCRP